MNLKHILLTSIIAIALASGMGAAEPKSASAGKPNIVFILTDDMGYGDVHGLNPQRGKIPTPCMDKLATQGMSFTEAHSSSAVCTPTRYGILTGRYNWRSQLQESVLWSYDKRVLIPKSRLTFPGMLKQQGYATAAFGKWHLGWTWPRKGNEMDFTQPIKDGPTAVGFDYFFGMDAPNFPPYCFIENEHTLGIPTELFKGGKTFNSPILSKAIPGWKEEAILPTLTDKVCRYIEKQAGASKPFFLYYAVTSPHTPIVPNKEWIGKSGLNLYADFVMETDAMIGRIMESLQKANLADNTLVVVCSDNGCSPAAKLGELTDKGHYPSADRRGYKADAWDGGHRIPCIVRWPGVVKPGSRCDQMICLNDWMATAADVTGAVLPNNAAEDSVSLLGLLKGENQPVHQYLVHHSIKGMFAIRDGKWKLLLCEGSGGWGKGKSGNPQLYDMTQDIGEKTNLAKKHPEIVKSMTAALEKIVADGRSTPGPKQKNDVPVKIYKTGKKK